MNDLPIKQLIGKNSTRCNDHFCLAGTYCARYRQRRFDNGTKVKTFNYLGSEGKGICKKFINADQEIQ